MELKDRLAAAQQRYQQAQDATILFELRAEGELMRLRAIEHQLSGQVQTLEELLQAETDAAKAAPQKGKK